MRGCDAGGEGGATLIANPLDLTPSIANPLDATGGVEGGDDEARESEPQWRRNLDLLSGFKALHGHADVPLGCALRGGGGVCWEVGGIRRTLRS